MAKTSLGQTHNSLRFSAVILDFDHTLAHLGTHVRWDEARASLVALYRNAGLPDSLMATHPGALGLYAAVADSISRPVSDVEPLQGEASRILTTFEAEAIEHISLLPAAHAFIRHANRISLPLGVVSSNSRLVLQTILKHDGFGSVFVEIVGRDEVWCLKPSPEGLLACCVAMSTAPGSCLYVGDSGTDVVAAERAGMVAFGVRGGMSDDTELIAAGAERVLDDVEALLPILRT